MGLLITTDDKGVKIYKTTKQGRNGEFSTYSLRVSSKVNDEWASSFIDCCFKKDVEVDDRAEIKIKNAFFTVSQYNGKNYLKLMITDFEYLNGAAEELPPMGGFVNVPEGVDDELPFARPNR